MKIHIFYPKILDIKGEKIQIGGVQNYIITLAKVLAENGFKVNIVQCSINIFIKEFDGFTIYGYPIRDDNSLKIGKRLFLSHCSLVSSKYDLIIWGSETIAFKLQNFNTLSIQHGLFLDYYDENTKAKSLLKRTIFFYVYKVYHLLRALHNFEKSDYKVCVDYNFLNWYRTISNRESENSIKVIPNFTDIEVNKPINRNKNDNIIKILFARRFENYRGVILMMDVVETLLARFPNVQFTFAGDGTYANQIKQKFTNNKRITITSYNYSDSLKFHSNFDIAVIPTTAMEGTSLSLLEAMAAGCAVIASNIGGITNIILNRYNGLLIMPTIMDLEDSITELIKNRALREEIGKKGQETIIESFNFNTWKGSWIKFIKQIVDEHKIPIAENE